MCAARASIAPSRRRPQAVARRSRWAVVAGVGALLAAACGAPPPAPPIDVASEPTIAEPVPVESLPLEPAGPPSSVRGIPLAEARAVGLWGRPFRGCVSIHGTPSPEWFDGDLLASAGWPRSQWSKVCRVVGCESNFEAGRVGGLGNRMVGLLQLDRRSWGALAASLGHGIGELLTPLANLRVGRALFEHLADAHGSGEAWLPSSMGGWSCAWAART